MTHRQRKTLVLILLALFLAVTPVALFYSQGYRFDWQTKTITQTGAFYIKAIPSRVDISINNVPKKKTDYIFDSSLVGNLLPASYIVRISKDQYIPWVKTLQIKPKEVTEAKNIVLFPSHIDFRVLFENITAWWPSPDNSKIVFKKQIPGQKWQLYVWDPIINNQRLIARQQTNEDIFNVIWAKDSSRFATQITAGENLKNTVWSSSNNTDDHCITGCIVPSAGQTASNLSFSQINGELFYLSNGQSLAKINYLDVIPTPTPIANSVAAFLVNANNILWLDTHGAIWQKNLSLNSLPISLTDVPYPVSQETPYELFQFESILFLKESKALFELTPQKTFKQISEFADSVISSPEKDKLLLSDATHLSVYYLQDQNSQPFQKAGNLVLLMQQNKIANPVWLTNYEIAFTQGNKIKASEIDARDSINSAELATYPNPNVFFADQLKTIFILSQGEISSSEKLLR